MLLTDELLNRQHPFPDCQINYWADDIFTHNSYIFYWVNDVLILDSQIITEQIIFLLLTVKPLALMFSAFHWIQANSVERIYISNLSFPFCIHWSEQSWLPDFDRSKLYQKKIEFCIDLSHQNHTHHTHRETKHSNKQQKQFVDIWTPAISSSLCQNPPTMVKQHVTHQGEVTFAALSVHYSCVCRRRSEKRKRRITTESAKCNVNGCTERRYRQEQNGWVTLISSRQKTVCGQRLKWEHVIEHR